MFGVRSLNAQTLIEPTIAETIDVDPRRLHRQKQRHALTEIADEPVGQVGAPMRPGNRCQGADAFSHAEMGNQVTSVQAAHAVGDQVDRFVGPADDQIAELAGTLHHTARGFHLWEKHAAAPAAKELAERE